MKTEFEIIDDLNSFIDECETRIMKAKRALAELTGIPIQDRNDAKMAMKSIITHITSKGHLKFVKKSEKKLVDTDPKSKICQCGVKFHAGLAKTVLCPKCRKKASNDKERAKKKIQTKQEPQNPESN